MRKTLVLVEVVLLAILCCGARAQQPPTAGPTTKSLENSHADETPLGGCLPIGVTSSGEVVFPFLCKEFLDRNKGVAATTPTEREITASERSDSTATSIEPKDKIATEKQGSGQEKSPPTPSTVETVSSINMPQTGVTKAPTKAKSQRQTRSSSRGGCAGYRTFDPESATYRDYSGRRRVCRF